jgi:excisionase family DNA binding protein
VFDRSASDVEHLRVFLHPANHHVSKHFPANRTVFGSQFPNARPAGMKNIIPSIVDPPAGESLTLLLRPREAAKALSISQRTLWSLTQRGELRAVRIGRAVAYSVEELRNFICRCQQKGQVSHAR